MESPDNSMLIPKNKNGTVIVVSSEDGTESVTASRKVVALSKKIIGCSTICVHIIALLSTVAVVQLRLQHVYWADIADVKNNFNSGGYLPREDVLNSLQFAAKIHEIFILGSLSAMVMHFIRRMLVGPGVPFGILIGAYQLGSAERLASTSFYGPLLQGSHRWGVRLFALSVGLVTVFANMVGPSSAIAMIPTLNWWPMAYPLDGPIMIAYFTRKFTDLYPQQLLEPNPLCLGSNSTTASQCPGAGFESLLAWTTGFAHGNPGLDNITMSQAPVNTKRYLATTLATISGRAIATTVTTSSVCIFGFIASSINFWDTQWSQLQDTARVKVVTSDIAPVLAPVVQVQCAAFDYLLAINYTSDVNVTFHAGYLYNNSAHVDPLVPPKLWNISYPLGSLNFTWASIPGHDNILGALITVPYVSSIAGRTKAARQLEPIQRSLIVPCSIQARWAPAKLSYELGSGELVVSNISTQDMIIDMQLGSSMDSSELRSQYGLSDPIRIDPRWASMLNLPVGRARTKDNEFVNNATAMEALLLPWVGRYNATNKSSITSGEGDLHHFNTALVWTSQYDDGFTQYYISVMNTITSTLAMVVADGLARAVPGLDEVNLVPRMWEIDNDNRERPFYYNLTVNASYVPGKAYLVNETHVTIPDRQLVNGSLVVFEVFRYGWGYEFETATAKFGVSVLFTYIAALLAYAVYYFIFLKSAKGWTSTAWGTVGDIIALAIISEAPEITNISGINFKGLGNWATKLFIRERGGELGGIQLLIGDEDERLRDAERLRIGKKYG